MAQYVPLANSDSSITDSTTARYMWHLAFDKPLAAHHSVMSRLVSILPTFLQPSGLRSRTIGPTSYLDALRGYAAFCVFIAHTFSSDLDTWRLQPFVNVLYNGSGMVALFFIISGYALGYRFLILIRKQESERLLNALASATFRRYIRLYASSAFALLIALFAVRLLPYNGFHPAEVPLWKPHMRDQFLDFMGDLIRFCNPFAQMAGWVNPGVFDSKYLSQMWSIPIEYRGSIALFSFCTAICKLSTRSRMLFTWATILACWVWQACYVSEFMMGLFIADLSLSRHPERIAHPLSFASHDQEKGQQPLTRRDKTCYIALFGGGLFLLGQPDGVMQGFLGPFPWSFLKPMIPAWWDPSGGHMFWNGIGAVGVIWALEFYPALQTPLHWRFSQYMGDLSFGLYAMHPIVWLGLYKPTFERLRLEYLGDSILAYIPGVLATILCTLVIADYFQRIDRAVVRFARWFQGRLFNEWL